MIHEFAKSGDTAALRAALDLDPKLLEDVDPDTNCTLLASAASHGHKDTVIMLLDRFATIYHQSL
jgi:hypothetical protein